MAVLLMLADPPGMGPGIVDVAVWLSPILFLLVITAMLLILHLGLAPPAKRMLNGWLIILMPLLGVVYTFLCRPLLTTLTGSSFDGIWWLLLLYPALVVIYWLVFHWQLNNRIEKKSARPE